MYTVGEKDFNGIAQETLSEGRKLYRDITWLQETESMFTFLGPFLLYIIFISVKLFNESHKREASHYY